MRILHAPADVGNQPWGVSLGERALGHRSKVLVYMQHFAGFGSDVNLHFERRSKLSRMMAASSFFLRSLSQFDIFHFYFATSFFPGFPDLRILKALKKKIFFTFQGCDIRPVESCPAAVLDPVKHRHENDAAQKRRLATCLQFAQKTFVLNPDLLDQSPTSVFLPYALDIKAWQPNFRPYQHGEEVVIFHAPSDRLVKGTDHVEQAVTELQKEGYRVRLDLVHGASHDEVLKRLSRAHIAVDQLLAGWYGAAAVEMMALGKPTLCFLRDDWIPRVPFKNELPIINVSPKTLGAVLRHLLDHPEWWEEMGRRGRHFVEKIHDPVEVAKTVVKEYEAAA